MQEPRDSESNAPNEGASPLFGGDSSTGTGNQMSSSGEVSESDERLWSILSHVSVLVAPIGALVIWLIYKDKSQRIGFHALQSLWYQVAWLVIIIAYSILSTILSIVVIGLFMFILLPFLPLIPIAHGAYAAYKASQGVDYRYPFIADKISDGARVG
jgi:uncharacterized Tic20 family protein